MRHQNDSSIHNWELYHLINDTQSKFVTAVKRGLKIEKEKKKEVKKPNRL
jgi:hypothetical protein